MIITISLLLMMLFVLLFLVVFVSILKIIEFKHGTYAKVTGSGFFETIFNIGRYGEYLTYKELKPYEVDGGKFLFNSYLPKDDGGTTEVDVMLIHSTGIFVIESKNYSGWIFGSEKDKTWTQTLRSGRGKVQKEHFYNPIMQNGTHIRWLKKIVGNNIPIYSIVAFSERCTLKNITLESSEIKVINRQHISQTVKQMGNNSILALSKMDVERVYEMLYPYTQVTNEEKLQHIDNINEAIHRDRKRRINNAVDVEATGTNEEKDILDKTNVESENDILQAVEDNQIELKSSKQNDKLICPRCGAEMVLRTAKKGEHAGEQFYGCSRFPKCRYKIC